MTKQLSILLSPILFLSNLAKYYKQYQTEKRIPLTEIRYHTADALSQYLDTDEIPSIIFEWARDSAITFVAQKIEKKPMYFLFVQILSFRSAAKSMIHVIGIPPHQEVCLREDLLAEFLKEFQPILEEKIANSGEST